MKCDSIKCPHEAFGAIAINVPAAGCPIAEHDPIKIVIGLKLCAQCIAHARAEEFMSEQLKKIVKIQARGLAEPDFKRAFLSEVKFESPEWLALKKK